jgi:iron complex transport system substrate-binding protein
MKNALKKLSAICLAAALFTLLVTSCAKAPESATPAPAQITDQLGRAVTIKAIPQRIVSLAPSNTEILFALGLGDRIVGVTDYCTYPPEAKEKPSIGGFSTPNIEEVIAKNPDLILANVIHKDKVIPQLESKGLTVIALNPKTIDEVLAAITLVGKVTGAEKEATSLVADMKGRIKAITDKTDKLSEGQKQRVLEIVWHDPLMAAGADTLHDELIGKAGGINIAHNLTDYADISLEAVIAANPEVMIADVGMGEGEDLPFQFLMSEPRLKETDARKNNRVYSINVELVSHPGPRTVTALEQLAKFIHPEIFKEQP